VLRGDVHEFRLPRGTGHEQQGRRYGVIVQANELLPRSVVLVVPTSRSAKPASFRPEIELLGETTRVLAEQVGAVGAGRLGELVGRVSPEQQWGIDEALMTVLGLR
jgi:mRNA interferase MazF